MNSRFLRLLPALVVLAAALIGVRSAQATGVTVHAYELGERITLTSGTRVQVAMFDISVENVASHTSSFCVDLYTQIGVGQYDARGILDADVATAPAGEQSRNFAWAGHVLENFGANIDALVGSTVSRTQAITGVQAAIWQGIYGGNTIVRTSLSTGARTIYDQIMGTQIVTGNDTLVAELRGNQDQIFRGPRPIPEPSAALVFGLGTVVAGSVLRRRSA